MRGMLWVAQALSGVVLVVLLGLHLWTNHTAGGLLTYAAVVQRLQDPVVFGLEVLFLVVAAFHGMNGLRAVLLDYLAEEKAGWWVNLGSGVLGVAAVTYGLWLSLALLAR